MADGRGFGRFRGLAAAIAGVVGCAGAGTGAQAPPGAGDLVVYQESATPTESRARAWDTVLGAWSAAGTVANGSADAARHEHLIAPDWVGAALLVMGTDRRLTARLFDGQSWGSAHTLTTNTGTSGSKVFAGTYGHRSKDLLVVYRAGDSATLRYRVLSGGVAGPERTLSLGLPSPPRWITLTARNGSDEALLLAATSSTLHAAVWDGGAFGGAVTLETALAPLGKPMDAAYLSQSGRGLVVWAPATGAPRGRVWGGSAWGTMFTLPAPTAPARWVTLAADPRRTSDDALLATLNTDMGVNLSHWNGASFASFSKVDSSAAAWGEQRVAAAYQRDGGRAVAVWRRAGQNSPRYRTWNGVSWSSTLTGPDLGSEAQQLELAPGRSGDELVMAVRRRGAAALGDYAYYSSEGNWEPMATAVDAPAGAKVSGLSLPAPPSAATGSTDLIYANHVDVTLAPGSYRLLVAENTAVFRLSAGTYRFQSVETKNTADFICNTDSGDITIIVTNGNWLGKNNTVIRNTSASGGEGPGRVRVHVRNGNLQLDNNTVISGVDFTVYNGNIQLGHGLAIAGLLHAKGNVKFESGVATAPWYFTGSPGRVSAVVWTDGAPGVRTDLSGSAAGAVSTSRRPAQSGLRLKRWTEVDPLR